VTTNHPTLTGPAGGGPVGGGLVGGGLIRSGLAGRDGAAYLAAMEAGEMSALELLGAHRALFEERNDALGAIVDADWDGAEQHARRIDTRRARGEPVGALAGLPITIKDSFDAAGLRTTHGRLLDARRAVVDAPVVRRLRQADAVVVGRTNVPVYLNDHQSTNAELGRTVNPWDPQRSPGGSSGGAAAAVAAGLSVLDLGSDLSGSLRNPASWCGLFGHRPSNGIVSKLGHMPWPAGGLLEPMVSAVGPMARSAVDCETALRVMVGPEGADALAWRLELPPPRNHQLSGARVALWLVDEAAPVDGETRRAIMAFVDRLDDAGCAVGELEQPPVQGRDALDLFFRLQAGEIVHGLDDQAWHQSVAVAAGDGSAAVTAAARGHVQSLRDALNDLEEQRRICAAWNRVFESYDVVVCPATPTVAPPLSEVPAALRQLDLDGTMVPATTSVGAWSCLSSLGRGPATVVPAGRGDSSGQPVGAQLLGPYLEDWTPLRLATLAQEAGLVHFHVPTGMVRARTPEPTLTPEPTCRCWRSPW
jgi:amidase